MEPAGGAPDISVVIPLYNERESIPELARRTLAVMRGLGRPFEVVLVDDGSTDGSEAVYRDLAGSEPGLRVVRLARNYGQTAAFAAGFEAARGGVIVTLDGDLQNPPEEIPRVVAALEAGGFDLAAGWRRDRRDRALSRRLPSWAANRIIGRVTGVRLHDYGCSLKAFRAQMAKSLPLYGELHRFIPVLVSLEGGRITEVPVAHRPRGAGRSKYGITRAFRVLMDLLTVTFLSQFGDRPQHAFGFFGTLLLAGGLLVDGYLAVLKIATGASIGSRPLLLLGTLMIISGIQLLSIGLLSEVAARTYYESQGKRRYRVRETIGR